MSWKPIDFQGILTIQQTLVHHLDEYLNEKESLLVHRLQNIFQFSQEKPSLSAPPSIGALQLKLSDAVEAFSKKVNASFNKKNDQLSADERMHAVHEVNTALWDYVEVLEGCVVELFQQLKQVGIDQWDESLPQMLAAIKEQLLHRIEDLRWTIRRLNGPLKQYLGNYKDHPSLWAYMKKIGLFFRNPLDSKLLVNLKYTEKFLRSHYSAFSERYNQYVKIDQKLIPLIDNQQEFIVLSSLDKESRSNFEQIWGWLKLRELDAKDKGKLSQQITSTLKNVIGIDQTIKLFKMYLGRIEKSLYCLSKELKTVPVLIQEIGDTIKNNVNLVIGELDNLMKVIASYREFLLKTDSNPYVRSRLGFSEWIVGPEPLKTRTLMQLVYDSKELSNRFEILHDSLENAHERGSPMSENYKEIEKLLHEMSSPLISQTMMRRKGESFLDYLSKCNILGSQHFETVSYVGSALNKAMRLDWKYHVLHEFPLFHHIFDEYQGLTDNESDPVHHARIEKLQGLFFHIEQWVANEDVDAHVYEISTDMNDMKTYLQDFLASVQRTMKDQALFVDKREKLVKQYQQQLLEYRYQFGDFFMNLLKSDDRTGTQVRNRFLFVDQYFETIEAQLSA